MDERPEAPRCAQPPPPEGGRPPPPLVTGRPVPESILEALFGRVRAPVLGVPVFVHVVGVPSPTGGLRPIVAQPWIDDVFAVASAIWDQACVRLLPFPAGEMIRTFQDLFVAPLVGHCFGEEERQKIRPYDIRRPGERLVLNLYLVRHSNGAACGSPVTGHIVIPAGSPTALTGTVLAHEVGHILLNPSGVDDSEHADHLMYHPESHPGGPAGSRDGLFIGECVAAQRRIRDELIHFRLSAEDACRMRPRLGAGVVVTTGTVSADV